LHEYDVHEILILKLKNKLELKSFQKIKRNLKYLKIKMNLKHLIEEKEDVTILQANAVWLHLSLKYKDK
jgi:hypothetical protein